MSKVITYLHSSGNTAVVIPSPNTSLSIEEVAAKSVPAGVDYTIIDEASLPNDRVFRGAWKVSGSRVVEDVAKVKEIAHGYRRQHRSALFSPYDQIIAAQVPNGNPQAAEQAREQIRANDAAVQTSINNAATVAEVRAALVGYGAI